MRLFVYDMLVNVNVIYYVHVCEQARWARSAGNSAIENICIIIIIYANVLILHTVWTKNSSAVKTREKRRKKEEKSQRNMFSTVRGF